MGEDPTVARPVPVVRVIIQNTEGEVLLLRRARTDFGGGGWCLPGGKIDYGETVKEAASRELLEETALECQNARFLFHRDGLPAQPGSMHCIDFYFECEVTGELAIDPDSSDWAWVGPADLDDYELVFGNDDGVRRYWLTKLE